jgi:acetyl-CoA carboxylase carboxyltransferase component
MSILATHADPQSPDYLDNQQQWTELLGVYRERSIECMYQGKEAHVQRHINRGYLLARDRLQLLIDPDSPFLELMPMAGWDQEGCTAGASIVAGIALVCGVECMVTASVPTLDGGAMNEMSVKKSLRLNEIVEENRLPCISLVQTAGANLRQQANVFHAGGAGFRNQARL